MLKRLRWVFGVGVAMLVVGMAQGGEMATTYPATVSTSGNETEPWTVNNAGTTVIGGTNTENTTFTLAGTDIIQVEHDKNLKVTGTAAGTATLLVTANAELEIDDAGSGTKAGELTIGEKGILRNAGAITNSGTIDFGSGASYSNANATSTITNSGGTLNMAGSMTGISDVFTALNRPGAGVDIGDINITGSVATAIAAGNAGDGTITLKSDGATAASYFTLNVADAKIVTEGTGAKTFTSAVSAAEITNKGGDVTYEDDVTGDLNVENKTTFAAGSTYDEGSIDVIGTGTMIIAGESTAGAGDQATVTIGEDRAFANAGAVENAGDIVISAAGAGTEAGAVSNTGSFTNTGSIDNDGSIDNTGGTFTLGATGIYSGDGTFNNSAGDIVIEEGRMGTDAGAGYVNSLILGAAAANGGAGNIGDITIVGGWNAGPGILTDGTQGNVKSGTLTLLANGADASYASGVQIGAANLVINGTADKTFAAALEAKTVTVKGEGAVEFETVGKSGVTTTITVDNKGGSTFTKNIYGDLVVNTDATIASTATFTGYSIKVAETGTLTNKSNNVTISNSKTFSNDGKFVNEGTITFSAGATYSGSGVINNANAGSQVNLNGVMTSLNAALNAMIGGNTDKDIGTVKISGPVTGGAIAASGARAGDVTLDSNTAATYADAIDLGGADLTITDTADNLANMKTFKDTVSAGSVTTKATTTFKDTVAAGTSIETNAKTTFDKAVSAGTTITTNGETVFSDAVTATTITAKDKTTFGKAVNADLIVDDEDVTIGADGSFSGYNMTINDGKTLINLSDDVTISAGKKLSNDGMFDNTNGTLTLAANSTYARLVDGEILNAGGTANVNAAITGFNDFIKDLDSADLGTVNVSGQLTSALDKSGAAGGTVTIKDQQTAAKKIDVGLADLNLDQGGVFTETVEGGAIDVKAASTFQKAVTANNKLLVNGESTFQEAVTATNGVTTNKKTVFMKDVVADATVNDDTTFNGSVKNVEVTVDGHARITATGGFVSLSNSGQTSLAIGNDNFTDQFKDVDNRTDTAVVNVIADAGSNRITEALENTSGRGVFNFGASGGTILYIEKQIDVDGGEYHASQGTTVLNYSDDSDSAIIADSFTVDSGAKFVYDYRAGGGVANIDADTHTVERNATLEVAAGDTLNFYNQNGFAFNTLTLEDGSKVVLSVDGNDVSVIQAAKIEGDGAVQNKSVTLDLDGSTLDYLSLDNGLADLLQATDVDWNIFNSDRFIINRDDGSFERRSTGFTLAPIMDNRNMVGAASHFDNVLAWNPLFGARQDIETGNWTGGLQGMLDEVYDLINQGNYGTARRMYGANTGEHLVHSDRGVLNINDMLWSAVDGRRNMNLDLNLGLNSFASRRSAGSPSAYGDLVPPNCYPTRSRSRTVRDRNGGYSLAGGNSTVWAEYLGAWAKQNSRNHIDGYKTHANGIALGYEYHLGQFNFGAALSYARAHTKMSLYSQDTTTDAFNMALYADYNHSSGFFGRAGLGFSYGWNDYTARGTNFHRSGDYNNLTWNLRGEIGYAIRTSVVNIIPSIGLRFSHYHQQSWTDKDKTGRGLNGDARKRNDYAMDIPLEVRVNKVYSYGGIMIAPEAKAGITYATKKSRAKLSYGLDNAPGSYTAYGVETGRTTGNIGLGVKAKFNPMVDAGFEYNFEFARKYRQHSVNLNVGISF